MSFYTYWYTVDVSLKINSVGCMRRLPAEIIAKYQCDVGAEMQIDMGKGVIISFMPTMHIHPALWVRNVNITKSHQLEGMITVLWLEL